MSTEVGVERPAEGVAVLMMDNGPRNFSTAPFHERLEEALTEAREAGTRVVILASAVDGFSPHQQPYEDSHRHSFPRNGSPAYPDRPSATERSNIIEFRHMEWILA